jgi:glycerate kinase
MTSRRIVIAPDAFKGTVGAGAAAAAIGRGWQAVRPDDHVSLIPMADGGDGTLEAFATAYPNAQRMPEDVTGPDDRPVACEWLLLDDGTGVVELAQASGLLLLDPLQPGDAHTLGFGELIAAALDHRVERLVLCIGGSASTDGGTGALTALGARFADAADQDIPLGNSGLAALHHVDLTGLRSLPPDGVIVLSDVISPLLGKTGAAVVFGPQKGADAGDIPILEANLARLAKLIDVDPMTPGAGAAGGVGFGLLAWGAGIRPGAGAVGRALGLPAAVASADLVITGEGRFDSQTAWGKVASYVLSLGREAGVDAALVAGSIAASTTAFADAVSLSELAGGATEALLDPVRWLEAAGVTLAERYPG